MGDLAPGDDRLEKHHSSSNRRGRTLRLQYRVPLRLHSKRAELEQLQIGARRVSGLVGYNDGRAEIDATTYYRHAHMAAGDVSVSFTMNRGATDIL